MEIEKALINDRLCVSKVSWKFGIPTIYNSAVICLWNLAIFVKSSLLLTVCIVFSVFKLKTRTAMNVKISVFINCVEAILYLLLYNLHNCTFKDREILSHQWWDNCYDIIDATIVLITLVNQINCMKRTV